MKICNKIFYLVLSFLFIIFTVFSVVEHPKMHKSIEIISSNGMFQSNMIPKMPQKAKKEDKKISRTEEISWNVWHSNLHNAFLNGVNESFENRMIISRINDTDFFITFTVSKDRKISNLKFSSSNTKDLPALEKMSRPVLESFNGTDVLAFPNGSKLNSKDVELAITTRQNGRTKLSPEMFDDVETYTTY